nr:hypothetical protein CFP56_75605 [Quercus suber]
MVIVVNYHERSWAICLVMESRRPAIDPTSLLRPYQSGLTDVVIAPLDQGSSLAAVSSQARQATAAGYISSDGIHEPVKWVPAERPRTRGSAGFWVAGNLSILRFLPDRHRT